MWWTQEVCSFLSKEVKILYFKVLSVAHVTLKDIRYLPYWKQNLSSHFLEVDLKAWSLNWFKKPKQPKMWLGISQSQWTVSLSTVLSICYYSCFLRKFVFLLIFGFPLSPFFPPSPWVSNCYSQLNPKDEILSEYNVLWKSVSIQKKETQMIASFEEKAGRT